MPPRILYTLFFIPAFACGSGAGNTATTGEPNEAEAEKQCLDRVQALESSLKTLAAGPRIAIEPPPFEVPLDKNAQDVDFLGPQLILYVDRIEIDGTELTEPLADALASHRKRFELEKEYVPKELDRPRLYVVAPSKDDSRIADVRAAATSLEFDARLVVRNGREMPAIQTSTDEFKRWQSTVEGLDDSARATKVSEAVQRSIDPDKCPELELAFGKLVGEVDNRAVMFAEEPPKAMRACKCAGINMDLLSPLMEETLRVDPRLGWIPL